MARHPVAAADIDFFVAVVAEVVNPAVLEEAAHDAAHADAIAQTAYTRPQGANATHDEIDLHSGLRSAIQGLNHVLVEQCIHLGDDASGTAAARVFTLAID